MKKPEIPANEEERIRALQSLEVLDTPEAERFDRMTRFIAKTLDVPIALICLVDTERQWFMSKVGLEARETSRDISFCGHAIHCSDMFVVKNALHDSRFFDNPLVTGSPNIRFYAGQPLHSASGHRIGTLCAIHHKPHELSDFQYEILRDFAKIVEAELQIPEAAELQKKLEEQTSLKEKSEAEINHFFTMSLDLLCIASQDGYFRRLNPAFFDTFGYTKDELLARPFLDFVHPEDVAKTLAEMEHLGQGKNTVDFENRYICKDGSYRWIRWSTRPLAETGMLYAAGRDVTAQKELEVELRAAKSIAESSNRTKSEFLANMSHELRTPLNSVIGFSNILRKNKENNLTDKQLNYVERISSNGKHLLDLINQTLDLSKIEAGRMEIKNEELDLCALGREVIASLESHVVQKDVKLLFESQVEQLFIESDRSKLKQVLTNLVGNGIKFTESGSVTIRLQTNDTFTVPIALEVIDTGGGIPESQLRSVFDAFFQGDSSSTRAHGGTGLGLNISQSLCHLLGYSISVESEIGVGSKFSIRFYSESDLINSRSSRSLDALPASHFSELSSPGKD